MKIISTITTFYNKKKFIRILASTLILVIIMLFYYQLVPNASAVTYTGTGCNIKIGSNPTSMLAVGTNMYTLNSGYDSIIDTTTGVVVGTSTDIVTAGTPARFAVNGYFLSTDGGGGHLYVYNALSGGTLLETLLVGGSSFGVAATGTQAFITNYASGTIAVLETATTSLPYISSLISVSGNPEGIVPVGSKLYVPNATGYKVNIIETAGTTTPYLLQSITTGGNLPRSISAVGTKVYVANYFGGDVTVIDTVNLTYTNTSCTTVPTVTVQSESSLASTTVTLNATISVLGSASSSIVGFQYGTTTSYGLTSSTTGSFSAAAFSRSITGLQPSTSYHYKAYAINAVGTGSSTDNLFTTTAAVVAPSISSIASSTTQTTASISWTTDVNASSTVNYGTTSSYGFSSTTNSLETLHTVSLTGLNTGTAYHFQVGGANNSGLISTSSDLIFTTAALTVPTVTVQAASSTTSTNTTLNGTISSTGGVNASIRGFNYGSDTSYGSVASTTGDFSSGAYAQNITGLVPTTTYHYQAFAINSIGLATSSDQTFTTTAPGPYVASGCNIRVGAHPLSIIASSTNLYVLNTDSTVSIINSLTGLNTGTTTNSGFSWAPNVYVGTKLFSLLGSIVQVYETATSSNHIGDVTVGGLVGGMVTLGTKVYVSNQTLNQVSVIETATSGLPYLLENIPTGVGAGGGGTVSGTRVYFTNNYHKILVIETAGTTTPYLAETIQYSHGLIPRSAAAIGTNVYVENYGGNDVTIIDTANRTWTDTQCANPAVPSAPLNFATTSAVGQTTQGLSWTAPFNGNNNITDYLIEYKLTSSPTWLTFSDGVSTATTATVTGLSSSVSYDFRVSAINAIGTSSPTNIISNGSKLSVEYLHVLSGGQSLSVGGGNTTPAISITQPYNNVMLSPGVEGTAGPLIPLLENGIGSNSDAETPSSGIANALHVYDGQSRPVSVGLHGQGSSDYNTLKKGTSMYQKGINQVTAIRNLVLAQGNTFKAVGVTMMHGENDYLNYYSGGVASTTYNYAGYLAQWQSDYQTDVNAITGATTTLPMFIDQVNSPASSEIAVQQLLAHKNNPGKVILIGPKYQYALTGTHLNNTYSKYAGEMFAKVINKVSLSGETWNPLMPTSVVRDGNIITISYAIPTGTLAIDTTNVAARSNYGFDFTQTGASATTSISSVQLINGNTQVQITLNNTPDGTNQKVRYAWTCYRGLTLGTLGCDNKNDSQSIGGNIRDTDSTVSPEIGSTGLPLYDFGVAFDEPVSTPNSAVVISNVSATPSNNSALITWTTSTSSDSYVNYGVVSTYGASTTLDSTLTTDHSQLVAGLNPCTQYRFRVGSKYYGSYNAVSSGDSFVTLGCTGSSTVTTIKDVDITTAGGGSLSQGSLTLTVPAAFTGTSSSANFQAKFLDLTAFLASSGLPGGKDKIIGSNVINLIAVSGTSTIISNFDQPLTVTIEYSPSDIAGVDVTTLKIYRYDGSSWTALSNCSTNTNNHSVTCSTDHFSDFAIFGNNSVASTNSTVVSGERSAVSNVEYGCKDPKSMNYNQFSASDPSMCKYARSLVPNLTIKPNSFVFSKNLQLGDKALDVKALQGYLNSAGFIVSKIGAGSKGNETLLFGPATKVAVIKFQKAKGIIPASGYVGSITRNYLNSH